VDYPEFKSIYRFTVCQSRTGEGTRYINHPSAERGKKETAPPGLKGKSQKPPAKYDDLTVEMGSLRKIRKGLTIL